MKWNEWHLIGVGVVIGLVLGAVYDDAIHYKLKLSDDGRLQWEILLSGAAALGGAGWTVSKIRDQITQTDRIADDRRKRRERAARAMLPLALSELTQYATACIKRLYDLRPYFHDNGSLNQAQIAKSPPAWTSPRLPENVLSLLKECVEFIDDAPAQAVADLIRHIQIQNYRLIDYISRLQLHRSIGWADIDQAIRDAAEVSARALCLFPFSRGDSVYRLTRAQVNTALSQAGCFHYQEIVALADKWEEGFRLTLTPTSSRSKLTT
jgi:hypothetical protein